MKYCVIGKLLTTLLAVMLLVNSTEANIFKDTGNWFKKVFTKKPKPKTKQIDIPVAEWSIKQQNGEPAKSMTLWKEHHFWDCIKGDRKNEEPLKFGGPIERSYDTFNNLVSDRKGIIEQFNKEVCRGRARGLYGSESLNRLPEICFEDLKRVAVQLQLRKAEETDIERESKECFAHIAIVIREIQQYIYLLQLLADNYNPELLAKFKTYMAKADKNHGSFMKLIEKDINEVLEKMEAKTDQDEPVKINVTLKALKEGDDKVLQGGRGWEMDAQLELKKIQFKYRSEQPVLIRMPHFPK